jgi:hypothetical protein
METSARSVLEAGLRANLPTMTLNRHLAVLRSAVALDDEALVVRPCHRADRRWQGDLLLTVTHRRLLLTREHLLRGIQLYLDADRADVADVRWGRHERLPYVELSFGHDDGRYLLWFPAFQSQELVEIEADIVRIFDRWAS